MRGDTMTFTFARSDIKKLERVLGVEAKELGTLIRFEIAPTDVQRRLALEIYPKLAIGSTTGSLVSVYTSNAHLQLHFCTGYVVSDLLGEVTFVGEHNGRLAGLIIEKEGGCSLFANVDRSLVSGDFTRLSPEVMLSGVALSLADTILESPARRSGSRTAPRGKRRTARR
jgi:hypothetical protein